MHSNGHLTTGSGSQYGPPMWAHWMEDEVVSRLAAKLETPMWNEMLHGMPTPWMDRVHVGDHRRNWGNFCFLDNACSKGTSNIPLIFRDSQLTYWDLELGAQINWVPN